jgi:two-component system sensor histidine kinase BarA
MPDIDGISLLGMMREQQPDNPVPIVALTANVLNDEAGRLLDLGFDYFLSKPIDETDFRELLDSHPERRSAASDRTAGHTGNGDASVDYDSSLALCADNESLLRQIFEIIHRDIPEYRQQLDDALAQDQRDRLAAIAHKLHGVTCYASLPRLKRLVLGFQQQLGRDGEEPPVSGVRDLIDELDAIEIEIDRHLEDMASAGSSA